MRYLIILLLLIPFCVDAQMIDLTRSDGTRFGINYSEVKFAIATAEGYIVRYSDRLASAEVSGSILDFYNGNCSDFGLFETATDTVVINKGFVSRVFDDGSGGSVLVTKVFRYSFKTTTPYATALSKLSSGCAEYPDNNLYYISADGDDETARKDNPEYPWSTNAAFLEDSTGVPLYVFEPGTYLLDTIGSGAYAEWNGTTGVGTMIPSNNANVWLKSGVTLRSVGADLSNAAQLFSDDEGDVNYNIYAPDATLEVAYDGKANAVKITGPTSVFEMNLGKLILDEPVGGEVTNYTNVLDLSGFHTDVTIDEVFLTGASNQDVYYLGMPDSAYHRLKVRKFTQKMDTLTNNPKTGIWYYGSDISADNGQVDDATFILDIDDYIIDQTNFAGYTGASGSRPSEYILRLITGGSRGYFYDSEQRVRFGRISYINPFYNTLPGGASRAGGLFISQYNGNTEIFSIQGEVLTRNYMSIEVGEADFSGRGTPFWFSDKTYVDSRTDLNLGKIRGNDIVVSMLQTMSQGTVFNIHCDYCVAENGPALGFDGIVNDSSKLVITGTWVTEAAGVPAIVISNAGTGQVILKDVVVINDGTVAAIQADVAQTITVSGVFDVNAIIPDVDITFVRNDY